MKTVSNLKRCIIALSFLSTPAFADKIMAHDTEERPVSICKALTSDSQVKLNRALKRTSISHHDVANGLICNGMYSLAYALQNKTYHNVSYLADNSVGSEPLQLAARKDRVKKEVKEKSKP